MTRAMRRLLTCPVQSSHKPSKVYVMSSDKIVEVVRPLDLIRNPQADETQALVGAVLSVWAKLVGNAPA